MKPDRETHREPRRQRRARRWPAALALLVIVGGVAVFQWRWAATPQQVTATTPTPPPLTDVSGVPLRGTHGTWSRDACLAATAALGPKDSTVHRWIDADGVPTYSDQAPPVAARDHTVKLHRDEAGVDVVIHDDGRALPSFARADAITTAAAIGKIFRSELGVTWTAPLQLRLHFTSSREEMAQRVGPESADRGGVYSPHERTIYVRRQRTDDATLRVLRHEISHALVHEWIGRLPTVLNEGLAEYFEHLHVRGMGSEIDTGGFGVQWSRQARDSSHVELLRLLGASGDFYGSGEARRYSQALGLATWLMDDPARRRGLARILDVQRSDTCRPLDGGALERAFGQPLAEVATHWAHYMRSAPGRVHRY